jgi:SPP1 gp7 family putative phage head morphogenesis protein|nr:MAG TPA: minor capsid protein [Caudoviricetes sp.]
MTYISNMRSPAYWKERAADRDAAAKLSEDEIIAQINKLYSQAFREVKKELNDWYNTYATENNLTYQEAQRALTPFQMQNYQAHMARLKKIYNNSHSPFILSEINRLSARAYLTQQMALIDAIDAVLIETAHNVQISIEDHLTKMYQREYKNTLESLNMAGAAVTPLKAVKEIIEYPYAGSMFSDRIWNNKKQLLNYINDDLSKNLIKGSSVKKMATELMDRCNSLYYQASRLVRTETNYAVTQGTLNAYSDSGVVQQYEFLAEIDDRTSSECKKLNGKVFNLADAAVGKNLPPLHPNCRSTIIPVVKKTKIAEIQIKPTKAAAAKEQLSFKNNKEAASYLKENYGFEKVSFGTKMSPDMATSIVNNAKKIFDKYPDIKGFVRNFEAGPMKSTYAYFKYGYGKNGNVLTLKTSTTLMGNVEQAEKYYNNDIEKGFHPKGTTYNDIIVHEMGHVIDAYLTAKKKGLSNLKHDTMTKEDMKTMYYSYSSDPASTDIINQAFKNLGITEMKDKSATIKNLSRYALESRKETLAEAFADAMANGDAAQPLSKEILKIIDKEMGK